MRDYFPLTNQGPKHGKRTINDDAMVHSMSQTSEALVQEHSTVPAAADLMETALTLDYIYTHQICLEMATRSTTSSPQPLLVPSCLKADINFAFAQCSGTRHYRQGCCCLPVPQIAVHNKCICTVLGFDPQSLT